MEDPVSPTASMASLWEASSATSEDSGNLYDDLDSPCSSESEVSDSDIFQELGVLGNIEEELPAYKESVKKAQEGTDIEEDPNDRTICESTASHQDAPNQRSDTTPQTAREETKKEEKTEKSLRNGTIVSENSTKNNVVPPDSPNTRSKMRKLREEEKAKKSIRKLTLESQAKERNRKDGCLSEQGDGRQRGGQTKDPDQDTPLTLPLASKNKDLQFILSRVMKNRSSTERKEPIPPHQELNPESGVRAENESGENNSVPQVNGSSSLEPRAKEKKKEREGRTVEMDSRGCVAREPMSEVYGRGGIFTVVKEKERRNGVQATEMDGGSCVTGEAAEARELPGPAPSEPPNSNTSSLVNKIMSMAGFSQRLTAADFMPEANTVKKYKIPKVSKASKKMKSSKREEGNELDLFEDVLVGRDRDELMKEIQKLKIERDSLQQSLHTSQERCSGLEKDNEVILKNMSALWKTSMAQLRQKTLEVATAKREKEAIIFRRAMRQVPRDELDRVVSHIAAYDKEEFAEFVSKLREKDEDSETKECTCGRGTPGTRRIGTVAQRVREAALGSRVAPSSDSKAQTLKTLLGRKGETVTHSEEKPESWSKRRGLTRSPKSQRRLFGSESSPPESEGSRSIWDRLGRNPLDRRRSGIEDERKERHNEKGRGASEEFGCRKRTEKGRDGGEEFGSRKHTEKGRDGGEEFGCRKHTEKGRDDGEEFGSRKRTEKGRDGGEERASKTPSSESTGGKRRSVFSRLSIKRTVHNQEESAGVDNSSGVPDSHPDSEIPQEKTGKRSEARRTGTPGDQHGAKARSSESCLTEPSKGISTPLSKPLDVTPSPSLKPDWTDMTLSAQEPEVEPEYSPDKEEEQMLSKTLFGQRMRRKMEKLRKQSPASKPLRDVPVLSSPVLSQDKSSEATQKQKQLPLQDEVGSVTNTPAMNTSKPESVEPKDVDIVTSRALGKGETAANSPRNIRKSVSVESKSVDTVTNRALEGEPAANSPRRNTRKSQSAESKSVDTVTNRDEGDMIQETLKHDIQKGKEPVEDAESRMRKSQSSGQKGSDKEKTEGLREADILRVKKVEESTKKRRNSENNSVSVKKHGRRHEDDIEQNPETVKEGNESLSNEQVTESAGKAGTAVNYDAGVKESRRRRKDDLEQNPDTTKEGKESLTNEQVMESTEKTLTTEHKPKHEAARVEKPNCEDIDSEEINNAILSLAKLRSAFHSEERKLRTKGNRLRKQKHLSLFGGDDSSDEGEVTVGEACKENQGTETCHNASVGNVVAVENTEIEGNEKDKSVDLSDVNTHISQEMEALLDMVENADCENFNTERKQAEKSVAESSTEHIRKGPKKRGLEEMETSKVTHQVQVQEPAGEEVEITDKRRRSRLLKKASAPNNTKDLKETVTSRVPHQGQVREAPSEKVEVSDKKEKGRSLKKSSASHTEEEEERSTEKEPKPAEDKNTDKVPVKRPKFKKEPNKKDKEGSARKNDNQQVKETPERERSRSTDEEETTERRKTEDQTRKADRQTRARTKVDSREEDEGKKVDQPRRERRKTGLREGDEKRKVDEETNEGKKTRREESEGRNNIDQLKRERRKTGSREENEETKTNSIEEDERKQRRERRKTGSREENEETKTNSIEEDERKQRRERRKTGSKEENEKRKIDEESTDSPQEDDERKQRRERRKTGSREVEKRKIDEQTEDSTKIDSTEEDERLQRRERRKTGSREGEDKKKVDEETKGSTDSTEEDERLHRRERRKTNSKEEKEKRKVNEQVKECTEADPMEEDERKQRRERRRTGSREDEKRKVSEQIKKSTKTDAAEEDERRQRRERRKTISMEENDQAKESSVTDLTEERESKKTRERRKTGSRNEDKSTNVDHQSKEATETDMNEGEESATTCQRTQAKDAPSHKGLKDNKPPEHENAAEIPEDSTRPSQNKDEGRRATVRRDSSREQDICKTRKSKRTAKGKSDESVDGVRSSKQLRGKRVEAPSRTPTPDTSGGLGSIDEVGTNAVDGMSFNPPTEDSGAETASSKTETMTFKPQTGDDGVESVSSATSTMVFKPPTEDHEAESVSSASFKSRTEDCEPENSSLKPDTLTLKPQTEDHKAENASKVIDSVSYKPQQAEGHKAENPSSKTDTNAVQEQQDHQTDKDDDSPAKGNKRPIEDNRQDTREPDAQKEKVTEGSIEAKENEQSTSEEPQTKLNTNVAGGKSPIKSTHESDICGVDPTEGASKDTTEEDSQETDILTSLLGTNYDEDSLFYQEEELLYDEGSEDEENKPEDENESEGRKEHEEESPISKTDTKKHDREDERNREELEKERREVDKTSPRNEDRDPGTGNSAQEDSAPKPGDKASHTTLPFLNTPSQKLKLPGGRIKKLTTSPRDKGSRGIEEGVSPLLVREGRRGEKPEVRSSRSEGVSPRSQGKRKDSPERGRRTREARSSHVLLSQNRKSPPRVRESRLGSRKRERESEAESPGKRERSPKRSPRTRGERSSPRQREIVDEREQQASKRRRLSVKSRLTFLHNSDEENITRPSRRQSAALEAERTRTSSRHRNQSGEKRPAADPHAHTHTRESSQQDGAQLSSLTDGKPKIMTSAVPVDSKLLQSVLAQSPSKLMAQEDEKEEGELDDEEEEEGEDCSDRKTRDSEKMKPSGGKRQTEVLKKDSDRNKTKRSSKERQNVSPDNRDTQGGQGGKADKQNTSLSTNKEDARLGDAEPSIHHNQTHHKQASQERQRHKSGGAVERVNSPRASQRIRDSSSNHQQTSQAKPTPYREKLALSETLPDHEIEEPRRDGRGAAEYASTIKEGETHRKSCNPRNENALRKRSPLLEPLPEYEIEKPKRTRKEASEFASAIEEEDQKHKSRTPKNKYGQRKKSPLSEAFEDQEETEKALELYASSVQEQDQRHKSRTPRNKNAPRKKSPLSELFGDQQGTEKAIEEENRKSKRLSPRKENALRKKSPISEARPDPEHLLDTEEEHQKQRKTQTPLNEKESRKDTLRDQGIEAPKRDGKGDLEPVEKAEEGEPRKRSSCAPMDENATFYPGDLYQAMHVKVKAPFRKDPSASSVSSLSDDTIDLMVKQHNEKFSDVTNASDDSETSLLKYIADDEDDNDGDDESESDEEINVDAVEEKEPDRDGAREDEGEMEFEDDGKQIELCDSDEGSETEEEVDAVDDVRAADENGTYGSDGRKEGEIEYKDDRKQSEVYSSDHESESEEEIVVDDFDAGGETKTHQTNESENEGETQHKDNTPGQNKGSRTMNQDTKRPSQEHGEAATTAHPTSPYQRDTTPRDECESEDESSSATSPESAPGVGERNSATPVFRQHESDSDEDGSESRSTRDTPTPASATHHSDSEEEEEEEEEEECSREGNTATPDSPVSAAHHSDVEIGSEDQNSLSPVSEMHHSDSEEEEGTREQNTRNTPTPASVTRHSNIEEEGGGENQNSLSPVSEMHHSDSEEEEDSRERNTRNTTTPASAMHHSDSEEEGSENQNSLSSVSEMQHSYSEGSSREQNTQTPVTEPRRSNSEEEEEEDCSEGSVHSAADNILPDTSEDEDMSSSEESELDVETVDSELEQPGEEVQQSGLPGTVPLDHQSSDGLKDTDDTESATELATGLATEPLDEGRVTAETQDAANNSSSSDDSDSDSDCQCSDCRSSSSSSSSSGSDSSSSSSSDSEEESAVVNEVEGVERPNPTGEDVEEESHDQQPSSHSHTDPPTQAVDKPESPNETGHKTPRKTPKKTPKKTPCKTPNAKPEGSQNSTTPFKKTPRKTPCKRTPCKKSPLKKAQGKVTKDRGAPVCPAASPVKEPQATSLASPVDENCVDDSDEAVDDTRSLSPRNTQTRESTKILSPSDTQLRDSTRIPSPSNTQSRIPCAENTQSGLDAETPLGRQVMRDSEGPGKTQKSTTTPASGRGSSPSKGRLRQVTPLPDVSNSQSFQLRQKISPLDSSPTRKTFYVKRRVSSLRVANAAPSMPLIDTGIVPVKAKSTVATSPSRTVKLSCSNDSPVISVVHSRQDEESHSPQRPAARSPKKMAQEMKVPTPTSNNPVTAKKRQRPPSPVLCDARNSSGKRLRTLSPSMYDSVSPKKLFSDATNVKKSGTVTHPNPESSSGPSEPCTKASISDVVVPVTIRRAKRQLNLQSSTSPAKQFSFISVSDQDSASPTGLREGGTPGQVLRKSPRKPKRVAKLNL